MIADSISQFDYQTEVEERLCKAQAWLHLLREAGHGGNYNFINQGHFCTIIETIEEDVSAAVSAFANIKPNGRSN